MAAVIGFVGYSNSGKTTLMTKVLAELLQRGYRVAVIKHDGHGHYKEAAGSDSTLYMEGGAEAVVTISPNAVHKYEKKTLPSLDEVMISLDPMDFVLVEGFKASNHPKIALFRTVEQMEILDHLATPPLAIATCISVTYSGTPVYSLEDIDGITALLEEKLVKY
jgi:molybdopterin-guanine dinucleotide biosynthesis protein B